MLESLMFCCVSVTGGRSAWWTGSRTAGWACAREGMFTPCCYLHAFGTCSGCLATCMFTNLNYLHALGNRGRTTKPCGRNGGWTCGWADGQPDSQVDVRPLGHAAICTQLAPAVDALRCACSQNYISYLHAFGNRTRTAVAARAGG